MKYFVAISLTLFSFIECFGQKASILASPESVNSDGNYLYITNIGASGNPASHDGDGFISKFSMTGQMVKRSITSEKLNGPKGTAIINGVLYVADLERIVGIDLVSNKKVREINLSGYGTAFTNDLAVKNEHTLFVSATDIGKIFIVDIETGKARIIADLKGANGIWYNKSNDRLYGCGFVANDMKGGEIIEVTWVGGKPISKRIGKFAGAFDGLALQDSNTLLVSDWVSTNHAAGYIEKIDLVTKKPVKLNLPLIYGPADFYLNLKAKRLVIPAVMENRLIFKNL